MTHYKTRQHTTQVSREDKAAYTPRQPKGQGSIQDKAADMTREQTRRESRQDKAADNIRQETRQGRIRTEIKCARFLMGVLKRRRCRRVVSPLLLLMVRESGEGKGEGSRQHKVGEKTIKGKTRQGKTRQKQTFPKILWLL